MLNCFSLKYQALKECTLLQAPYPRSYPHARLDGFALTQRPCQPLRFGILRLAIALIPLAIGTLSEAASYSSSTRSSSFSSKPSGFGPSSPSTSAFSSPKPFSLGSSTQSSPSAQIIRSTQPSAPIPIPKVAAPNLSGSSTPKTVTPPEFKLPAVKAPIVINPPASSAGKGTTTPPSWQIQPPVKIQPTPTPPIEKRRISHWRPTIPNKGTENSNAGNVGPSPSSNPRSGTDWSIIALALSQQRAYTNNEYVDTALGAAVHPLVTRQRKVETAKESGNLPKVELPQISLPATDDFAKLPELNTDNYPGLRPEWENLPKPRGSFRMLWSLVFQLGKVFPSSLLNVNYTRGSAILAEFARMSFAEEILLSRSESSGQADSAKENNEAFQEVQHLYETMGAELRLEREVLRLLWEDSWGGNIPLASKGEESAVRLLFAVKHLRVKSDSGQ